MTKSPLPLMSPGQGSHLDELSRGENTTQVSLQNTPVQDKLGSRKTANLDVESGQSQSRIGDDFPKYDPQDSYRRLEIEPEVIEQDAQPRSPLLGSPASQPTVLVKKSLDISSNCSHTWDESNGTGGASQHSGNSTRNPDSLQHINSSKRKAESGNISKSSARNPKRAKQGTGRSGVKQYDERITQSPEPANNAPEKFGSPSSLGILIEAGHAYAQITAGTTLKITSLTKSKRTFPDWTWRHWVCFGPVEISVNELLFL